jgi:hypothetical protein
MKKRKIGKGKNITDPIPREMKIETWKYPLDGIFSILSIGTSQEPYKLVPCPPVRETRGYIRPRLSFIIVQSSIKGMSSSLSENLR